jgi:class 3 adenylate cyclase
VKRRTEEFISPALRNDLIELVAGAFSPDGINELGRLTCGSYNSHEIAGEDSHITISRRRAALLLVEHAAGLQQLAEVIRLIAELDGGIFLGKQLSVKGIESFFNSLARVGIVYDPTRRRLYHSAEDIRGLKNWGSLRDGRTYEIAVISVDIVGNSVLVRQNGTKTMEKLYFQLRQFLDRKLADYDGRVWNWAGDGGILAFAFDDGINRAVKCAIDIQTSLPLFNISPENPVDTQVALRTAVDTGSVRFYDETGRIVSEIINYAAHLEKAATEPGKVSLSERARQKTNPRILSIFGDAGLFEGAPYFTTLRRLDLLFAPAEDCEERVATA